MRTMFSVRVWVCEDVLPRSANPKLSDHEVARTVHTIEYGYNSSNTESLSDCAARVYRDWENQEGPFENPVTLARSPIVGDYIELTDCGKDTPNSYLYRIDEIGFTCIQISQRLL